MKKTKKNSLYVPKDIFSLICGYLKFKEEDYKSLELVCRSAYEGSLQYSNNKTSKWNLHYLSLQEKRKLLYCRQYRKSKGIKYKFRSIIKIEKCEEDLNTLIFALNHSLFTHKEFKELNVWSDRKDVLFIVKRRGYSLYYAKQFQDDKEVVLEAVKTHGRSLMFVSGRLKNDREIVLEAVKNNGDALQYANIRFIDDKEIVLISVKKSEGELLKYGSERLKNGFLKNDREIVLEAVKKNGLSLIHSRTKLKDDKEIVLEAVKQNGHSLFHASPKLKNDEEIVLEAVKQIGTSLGLASGRLRNDREIVFQAVRENGESLHFASERLKDDKSLFLLAIKNGFTLKVSTDTSVRLMDDKEVVLEVVKRNGMSIRFASTRLKDDREIVLEAVKSEGRSFKFASARLRDDKDIFLEAAREKKSVHWNCWSENNVLEFASDRLKGDKKTILEAIRISGDVFVYLRYVSGRLKNDRQVVFESVIRNEKALDFVGKKLSKTLILERIRINYSQKI